MLFAFGVLCLSASRATAAGASDTFEQRVRPCAACHGEEGRAAPDGFYPRIAGKPAGYLFEQLLSFREGRRRFPLMAYMVDRQDDDYLRRMAEFFADLNLPYPPPAHVAMDPAQMARGEALVHHGDEVHHLPACQACHGERLTGTAPAVPGLVGLPRDYLFAQLGNWREGVRHARAPDCMAEIAGRLLPGDLEALSGWLASQPVPEHAVAPTVALHPPLHCGSIEARR